MTLDPLSEVFSLLDVRSAATSRLEAGDAWALRFPAKPSLKFHAVLRGKCWISLPGRDPCLLDAGDTFLLANSPPFVLAHDPSEPPEDAVQLFGETRSNLYRYRGDDTVLLGGRFIFGSANARLLLDALPPFMLIPSRKSAASILRSTLEVLDSELTANQMGSSLMIRGLADILLVQALRAYVHLHGPNGPGWLGALNDRHVGAALVLMHTRVGHHWKVSDLAAAVGMSRSAFAARFKELVGIPPLEYLLAWRMQLAREALRQNHNSVASIAATLGYSSESAFGNAFKRAFGRPPKRYWAK
jgi:AraC-like DNA-binding protein